ncbi:restriction endonuclease subunit S [Photobacterium leiognathi]|uniref:restriction endonuclease subunit S n=1 Tax=Photobacterium leiognathi TaxID=553611 RepID=UPI00298294E5|nr:restriction endonuclease subunit S [Photobacterium leiognathi]
MTFSLATSEVNTNPKIWKLKDICSKIGSGATPRGGESAYLDERVEYAFVRSQNVFDFKFESSEVRFISDESAQKLKGVHLQKDDILLNITGDGITFSRCCIVDERILPAAVNQHVAIIRVNQEICLPGYLLAFLCAPETKAYIASFNAGGSRRAITKGHIESFEIPAASLKQQEAIQNIVYSIIQKIELNREAHQTLEQMAQAIFKSWFVDFDPVKAKMNGDQPEGMDAATASLFPEKLVESELGLIPEGWDAGTLSDVAKYCSARTSIDSICLDNYISTENMLADRKGVTTASKLPTAKMVAAYKTGDVLVSNIRPYFKKIWLAEGNGGRSNDVLGFESSVPNTDAYIMNLLYQDTFFEYMTRTSKGAKMPRGDKTAIMNWEIAVPPVDLREAYTAIVGKFYKLIPENRAQNETLESLRDALLPKLLSGEIELGNAEESRDD